MKMNDTRAPVKVKPGILSLSLPGTETQRRVQSPTLFCYFSQTENRKICPAEEGFQANINHYLTQLIHYQSAGRPLTQTRVLLGHSVVVNDDATAANQQGALSSVAFIFLNARA